MLGIAALLVLGSGFIHAVWNLYTKRSMNKHVFLWGCQLIAIAVFLPWTIMELDQVHYSSTALIVVSASMLLHGLYVVLLAAAYSVGDLSQVYPIMRGTSPLLVPLAGVFLLDERLSPFGWAGVALIVVGIVLVSGIRLERKQGTSLKAPMLALAVGLCIAGYIVIDKIALDYVPAVVLNEASNIGNVLALSWATFKSGAIRREIKINWKVILLGGVLAPAGYLLFLFALTLAPVAQLAPMREIGTVFGTVMGVFLLREAQGRRRLVCSMLITAGVVMLGLWGPAGG
ncbi:LuxR family transcriptional regulator [Paenibacillus hemerocallicola]|uniref:LuxR family transcriptional regulator n=1 Tax=Paenibacillus hemerocallicola TaxID=1172614 RepID=A0A5C4SXU3_9BACL|nr:DMT family transporter [Paenibacillus hemerocallicola]TNJ56296.1 LuxR family transcriptional regulator [Paenibacillus hemerocallicola]